MFHSPYPLMRGRISLRVHSRCIPVYKQTQISFQKKEFIRKDRAYQDLRAGNCFLIIQFTHSYRMRRNGPKLQ